MLKKAVGRRPIVFATLLLTALAVVSQSPALVGGHGLGSGWRTIGRDAANTRYQPHEHHINPSTVSRLAPLWVASTAGDVSATPAVAPAPSGPEKVTITTTTLGGNFCNDDGGGIAAFRRAPAAGPALPSPTARSVD